MEIAGLELMVEGSKMWHLVAMVVYFASWMFVRGSGWEFSSKGDVATVVRWLHSSESKHFLL